MKSINNVLNEIQRFSNSGSPVAVIVEKGEQIVYGLGMVPLASEYSSNIYNAIDGFVLFDVDAQDLKKRMRDHGMYVHSAYELAPNSSKIVATNGNCFVVYNNTKDVRKFLRKNGHKLNRCQQYWENLNRIS